MMGQLLPFELDPHGHIAFPTDMDIEAGGAEQGYEVVSALLFTRQQIYNQARALEFARAYLMFMIDHRKHPSERGCLEEGIELLLAQMFENHPLVTKAQDEAVEETVDREEGADYAYALDVADAVKTTLMMQTLMGMAEFMMHFMDQVAERENHITHKAMDIMNSPIGTFLKIVGGEEVTMVPEDRLKMLHQPSAGWLGRLITDYSAKCAEVSGEWVPGNLHVLSKHVSESEMCQMVRDKELEFEADGRVKDNGQEDGK